MAKKTNKPKTTEEFAAMDRELSAAAAVGGAKRWEEQRRQALANRTMAEIVAAHMSLPEEVKMPTDFVAAWASDRPVFLELINRALTAEETKGVAHGMAVLLEYNRRLRLLAQDLVDRLEKACNAVNSVQLNVNAQIKTIRNVWVAGEDYVDVEED